MRRLLLLSLLVPVLGLQGCFLKNLLRRKCPIESCRVRMQHYHEDQLFRSRVTPIWKNQNPQIGQDWKPPKNK